MHLAERLRPVDHASHAFNKQSNPVVLTSPVSANAQDPTEVANDITFTWQDYWPPRPTPTRRTPRSPRRRTEAQQYRLQVSTTPDFTR